MGLDELRECYEDYTPEDVRKDLNISLAMMGITGKLETQYVALLDFAREKELLQKEEIDKYKILGYNKLAGQWIK